MEEHAEVATVLNDKCQRSQVSCVSMFLLAQIFIQTEYGYPKTVEHVIVSLWFNAMQYIMSTRQGIGTWEDYECGTCDQWLISEPTSQIS